MSIVSETFALDLSEPGLVVVEHRTTKAAADGASFEQTGSVAFELDNGWWVSDALIRHAPDTGGEPSELLRGDDVLTVIVTGHDMAPYVNLRNHRAADAAARPGYASIAMTPALAYDLAKEIAGLPFGAAVTRSAGSVDARVADIDDRLASSDRDEVYDALIAIGKQGHRDLAGRCISFLTCDDETYRDAAIKTLTFYLRIEAHKGDAIRLLATDPDEEVRASAAMGLGSFASSDAEARAILQRAAGDENEHWMVRDMARTSAARTD